MPNSKLNPPLSDMDDYLRVNMLTVDCCALKTFPCILIIRQCSEFEGIIKVSVSSSFSAMHLDVVTRGSNKRRRGVAGARSDQFEVPLVTSILFIINLI